MFKSTRNAVSSFFAIYAEELKSVGVLVILGAIAGLVLYIACSLVLLLLKYVIGYNMASAIAGVLFIACAGVLGFAGCALISEMFAKRAAALKAEAAACAAAKPVVGERIS